MKKATLILGLLVALTANAPAQEMSVISGKLLGYDGKPMRKAHVHLLPNKYAQSVQTIEVTDDGSFEIQFKDTGLFYLNFAGVNHRWLMMPLLVEKPLRENLAVRLKLYEYVDDLSKVKIMGDFNNFEFGSAQPMAPQADGTFLFEMDTTANTFAYQIVGAEKRTTFISGTQADDFVHNGWGYRSVVKVNNGKVKIIFDPKKLVRGKPGDKEVVQFENPNSFQAQFYSLAQEQMQRRDRWFAARKAYMDAHQNDMSGFTYDYSAELIAFPKRIAKEKSSTFRQVLLLQYLDLGGLGDHEKLDKKLIKQAFAEIPATSPLWELSPLIMEAVQWLDEPGKYDHYVNQALEKHPDRSLRESILYTKLAETAEKGDTAQVRILYNRMMNEFGDGDYAPFVKSEYDPNRVIMKGKKAPTFSVASLDQTGVTYSNETMKGKIYLIDFWTTWCPPCVKEMPNLHQTYKKFKDRNFEILSLSFDYQTEDVAKFRSGQWKMPWLHTFVEKGFDSDYAKAFEVQGIPKPVLVDGNTNTILATGDDLFGERLEKTLAKVLGEQAVTGRMEKQ